MQWFGRFWAPALFYIYPTVCVFSQVDFNQKILQ
ncbi:hypothetical protein PS687_02411 [Pseudomonas fluorescens]|nr:hypothetical protein PS687_02411 [Pseudomonas fluorescens]